MEANKGARSRCRARLRATQKRGKTIPIAIALRKDFAASSYRDAFVRALNSPDIECAYIASGFFSDFTEDLDKTAPDFGIGEDMAGKEVFLFGGYQDNPSRLRVLRAALNRRGLKAYANRLLPVERGGPKQVWHAKVAVFLSDSRPVLAIVGSSNLTGRSMYGCSEWKFTAAPRPIQVEADTFFWLSSHMDASQTMHDVFHYWGGGRIAPHIAFNDEKYDSEVEKLIQSVFDSLMKFDWCSV